MKKVINRFLKVIAENITTLVAIITGIWLFFSYKNYNTSELLAYIISILTLIAGSLLIEKLVHLTNLNKHVKNIESKLIQSDIFLYCHTSQFWKDALSSAKSLFLSGGSLFYVLAEKSGDLETLLNNGCKIEVVVVKPYSDAANLLYKNVIKEIQTPDKFSSNIVQTLDLLLEYKKAYPKQLVIRLNDHVPPFGIFAVYRDSKPLKIQVNLFSEKVSYDKRLALSIDDSVEQNHIAYDYFCNQITSLRNRLKECSIEDLEAIINKK